MARVKKGVTAHRRHKKILKLARGYRGSKSKLFKKANETVMKALYLRITELYKKMETLLCDDAANLYIEDMACEVALRSDFAGYRFYPLYVQNMAKIYKVK